MRLIDADELIKAIEQSRNNNPHKDCVSGESMTWSITIL